MVEVLFLRLMRSLPLLRSTLPFGVLLRRQLALSRLDGTPNHFGNSASIHHRERPPLRGLDSLGLRVAACRRLFKCGDRWRITPLVVQPYPVLKVAGKARRGE